MTTKNPNQPSNPSAQGKFQEFDSSDARDMSDPGELGEFSLHMLNKLGNTIENELIPRLMLAFDSRHTHDEVVSQRQLSDHIPEFVQLLIEQDAHVAARYVDTLRSEGIPLTTLYLDLLSPAARRLGEMWEEDECSFADVTIGVCRMHQVLLEFTRCFDASVTSAPRDNRNALIAPVPGEQHTFGLFMVLEFLRRDGWTCYSGTPPNRKEFLQLAQTDNFDLIGLSVSADRHVDDARRLIADLRRLSDAKILAGGRALIDNPELVKDIGADAMATDGEEAVKVINELVGSKAGLNT